jgi:hypothetical protein
MWSDNLCSVIPSAFNASIASMRCGDAQDGRRCQLIVGHDDPHAAMVSRSPFVWVRWHDDAVWSEWESYRFNLPLPRMRWAIACPRIEP